MSVALFPYLESMDKAQSIIRDIWDSKHTGWTLKFVDWDCYIDDPTSEVDVFFIDCLFEEHFKSRGMISDISISDISNTSDYYGCFNLKGTCTGIPVFLCQDVLIYPSSDTGMGKVTNTKSIADYVGNGNVWTLTGGNMDGSYLRAYADIYGFDGMFHSTDIDENILAQIAPYLELGGDKAALWHCQETADAFIKGEGRAYVGFFESLSQLQGYPEPLSVTNFSIAGNGRSNYFYADKACINSSVKDSDKRTAALLLANILGGEEFLERYIANDGKCLFYIPARYSVCQKLEQTQPVYHTIDSLAAAPSATILYGDSDFKEYDLKILSTMQEYINNPK